MPKDLDHAVVNIGRVRAGERVTFDYRIRRPADRQVRWQCNMDVPMHNASERIMRIGGVGMTCPN